MLVLSHPRVRGRLQRSQFWNPHNPPSNLGAIPWGGDVPDNADVDKGIDGGQSTVSPLSSPEQSETEYMSQGGQEDPEVIFPVPDSDEPLSTPPKPGTKPVVMSLDHVSRERVRGPIVSTSIPLITTRIFASFAMQVY